MRMVIKMKTIGTKLKYLRNLKNLKQEDVAEMLDINRVTYQGYEKDKHIPDIFMLCKIADIYFVSLDWLAGRYDK